jgi:hypothetical protein
LLDSQILEGIREERFISKTAQKLGVSQDMFGTYLARMGTLLENPF